MAHGSKIPIGLALLVSWRGQLGSCNILDVWRMTLLWLMWCIWREQNVRSFEDCEILVVEWKSVMFKSLYAWRSIIVLSLLVIMNFLYSGFLFLRYMGIELLVKNIRVILEPYKRDWNRVSIGFCSFTFCCWADACLVASKMCFIL